ncbi:MAG: prepilin-type N-terminal cleavage/methylation domain-containing protein [Candidatus Berkelbacteria bacterium]|nr:prepilin-type N-terminal cleavage/methylation domain-containing protein [Candidatus Berkelbacteria bacterium]
MNRRGFSLLETLIATGVLIVVILGVMSLSNSLIAGTVVNADKTIINRWASEGVELTQKIRDDTILTKSTSPRWFEPAIDENGGKYGWYKLSPTNDQTWSISRLLGRTNKVTAEDFISNTVGEPLKSDKTLGFRLICVEAVGAQDTRIDDDFYCNTTDETAVSDGSRNDPNATVCQPGDLYCGMTYISINKNRLLPKIIIPSGNAVKIRSVVVWQDKDLFRSSSMATLLTNWKGYEQ